MFGRATITLGIGPHFSSISFCILMQVISISRAFTLSETRLLISRFRCFSYFVKDMPCYVVIRYCIYNAAIKTYSLATMSRKAVYFIR